MKKLTTTRTAAMFFSLGISIPAFASSPASPTIDVPFINSEATVDGDLNDKIWQTANRITLDYETEPAENKPAKVKTEVLLAENGNTLYIAFRADDPNPQAIRAFLQGRDQAYNDDYVGITLDTYDNERQAYQFFSNPLGVQMDLIQNDVTGTEDDTWDAIWDSAGIVTDKGYQVEMAIPFRVLNFNESDDQKQWGVEVVRNHPRETAARYSYIPIDRNRPCHLCQLGHIQGMKEAKQGTNVSLTPAFTSGSSEAKPLGTTNWEGDQNSDLGADLKWGINPDVSLNATYNPDFSQVEADVGQLDVNNTFALFFPEKRQFFLDNADYLNPGHDLLYTRNIASPQYGSKLTGREQNHLFGVMTAEDTETNILIPGNRASRIATLEMKNQSSAFRYRNDLNNQFSAGVFGTLRTGSENGDNYSNQMTGLDTSFKLNEQNQIDITYAQSTTEYPQLLLQSLCGSNDCDQPQLESCTFNDCRFNESILRTHEKDQFAGDLLKFQYEYSSRNWTARAVHSDIGSDFRADLGFIGKVDVETSTLFGAHIWHGNESTFYNRLELNADYDVEHNQAGELLFEEYEFRVLTEMPLQSNISFGYVERDNSGNRQDDSDLSIQGNVEIFREKLGWIWGEIQPRSGLKLQSNIIAGKFIDYENNRIADKVSANPAIFWNLNQNIELELRHSYQDFRLKGTSFLTANLTDMRLTYQFDVRSSLRLAMIYNNIKQQSEYFTYRTPGTFNEKNQFLSSQLLYSYKVNPATVFFLGYSDRWRDDRLQSFNNLEQEGRSVFLKLSYAFQY